ncbi:hypothetical protein [Salsuginibacillus kocurii]|uniref:hypothetical protein n=1 Tax=Salsuginibacillus kocurii TaxID=427078 RepID=UPI0003A1F4DE|nr:hypothetical protein [Salsuginibacillus kocurii]
MGGYHINVSTTDICDNDPYKVQLASLPYLPYGKKRSFAGPGAIVNMHEDNVLVEQALKEVPGA